MEIKRIKYMPYKIDTAMLFVSRIGKLRTDNFVIDNDNKWVYENLIRWVHGDPEFKAIDPDSKKEIIGDLNKGIYIAGGTGTGKSWAAEIMSRYMWIDDVKFYSNTSLESMKYQSIRTDKVCEIYTEQGTISIFKYRKIICFQDFASDSEPLESGHYSSKCKVMQSILESRGDRRDVITLITSNIPITHELITQKYGARVQSRFYEMFNYLELKGVDRRAPKYKKLKIKQNERL